MINKDLIHEKVGELMNLTVECEMDSQDYDDLITLLQQRIEHTKPVSIENLIIKSLLKIRELDSTIEFVPCEVMVIHGLSEKRCFSFVDGYLTDEENDKLLCKNKDIREEYYKIRNLCKKSEGTFIPTFDTEEDGDFLVGYDIRELNKENGVHILKKVKIRKIKYQTVLHPIKEK